MVPEPQSTQNSINEQENAGMLPFQKHLVSEFSRTGKVMFEDLIFVFVVLSGKGSELLACYPCCKGRKGLFAICRSWTNSFVSVFSL